MRTAKKEKQEYSLDPIIAASLRVPLRTDLSKEERVELARLKEELAALTAVENRPQH
jgi:hypothetical protein